MANTAKRPIPLRYLHALARQRMSDGELLRRYLAGGDEEAFAEIVRREGPLVLRACRHVLGETTAAEDSFQATFLLLARKGRRLRPDGSLAGWLHAAAVRIAGDARRAEGRRRRRESGVGERAGGRSACEELMWREVRERLDSELAALPEKYRLPLVLCYLQELSYEEAAYGAGCSTGALRGRLERGKKLLRQRLARYGLPLAAPVLVLGPPSAISAALSQATRATVKAGLNGGAVPAAVAALVGPAISLKAKVLSLTAVVLAVCGFAWASGSGSSPERKTSGPVKSPAESQPATPPKRGMDARGDPLPPGAVARFGTRRFQVPVWPQPMSVRGGKAYLVYRPGDDGRGRAAFHWMDTATGKRVDAWPVPLGPVFDAETGKPTTGEVSQTLVALSTNGRWVAFTDPRVHFTGERVRIEKLDPSFNLYVYDLTSRKKVKHLRGQLETLEIPPAWGGFSADGKWLASGGNRLRLWDVRAGKPVWTSKAGEQGYELVGFTPGNRHLILRGYNDSAIVIVDTARGKIVRTIATQLFDRGREALLSPDGRAVVMKLVNPGETVVWDLNSGKPLPPAEDRGKRLEAWAFSPDGKTFVCAVPSDRTQVIVRDWPSRKVRRRFELGRSGVSSLFVSADNRTVNVLFGREQTLHRYDLESGKPLPVPGETHRSQVVGVEVAADGQIVSLGSDQVMRMWDLASGRQTRQVALDWTPAPAPFALSRDGKLISAANASLSAVVIMDRRGKTVRRIDTASQGIDHVEFSPSGRFLAGSGPGLKFVRVWETATGKTVTELPAGKGVWWSPTVDFTFSPDERYFVASMEGRVQFWETGGWRSVEGLPGHVSGLAFSPDGRTLACGTSPHTTVWEVATRKLRVKLGSTKYWNWSQRFSPDGRLVARFTSAEAEVWDVLAGRKVATFQGHEGPIKALAFTNDSRYVITASDDCTLLAWDVAGAVAADRAQQKSSAPTEKELNNCWKDLSSANAEKAFAAIRMLVSAPERGTELVRMRVKAAAPLDAAKIRRLFTDLSNESFAVRRRALQELQALGGMAELPLRRFLASDPSLEARTRAEQILSAIMRAPLSSERLKQLRAVEVLEKIGSGEARAIIQRLSKGAPEAPLTRDATATLRRIESGR
jgi:RNA polymerase sigma factor (sigma-70 family)